MSTTPEHRDQDRSPARTETPGSVAEADARTMPSCQEDEPLGGDPPCWAHLFEDDEGQDAR